MSDVQVVLYAAKRYSTNPDFGVGRYLPFVSLYEISLYMLAMNSVN